MGMVRLKQQKGNSNISCIVSKLSLLQGRMQENAVQFGLVYITIPMINTYIGHVESTPAYATPNIQHFLISLQV